MYRKKLISAVAALAVLTTGAMAFECTSTGDIQTAGITASYTSLSVKDENGDPVRTTAANPLELSDDLKGDALIYPVFSQKKGVTGDGDWKTEIVVRNTTNKAIIAKVALFRAEDSLEIRDFNIYLTPKDAFRFTIANNKITTKDGSILKKQTLPNQGDAIMEMNKDGEEMQIGADLPDEAGYVVVYGMAQYSVDGVYHDDTESLARDYRLLLDNCRTGWRNAYGLNGMVQGMMTFQNPITPTLPNNCAKYGDKNDPKKGVKGVDLAKFGDTEKESLIGTVRIYNGSAGNERDMILNATALKNYTDDNMILWAPGEFADFADRGLTNSTYNAADVLSVANAFLVNDAFYTYNKDDARNVLIVTQPMKRILMQMHIGDQAGVNYWTNRTSENYFGGFKISKEIYNETEDPYTPTVGATQITSPYGAPGVEYTYNYEVQALVNLEYIDGTTTGKYEKGAPVMEGGKPAFKDQSGFVKVNFLGNTQKGLPAIVTQMVGSYVNGKAQTNWIYAPVTRTHAN